MEKRKKRARLNKIVLRHDNGPSGPTSSPIQPRLAKLKYELLLGYSS
jgi:hypothetical protein